ncbi:MAG: class I SAM-dependent methyltransferase [Anaerolineae bacterium]
MSDADPRLDELVAAVRRGPKYRDMHAGLVRRIGARELAGRRNLADAVKATKSKLHQVAAAYLPAEFVPEAALASLRQAATGSPEALRAACREVMAQHVSTRERLPILDHFYAETLAGLSPRVVLDVACGLNPLAIPWMPLAAEPLYCACDAHGGLAAFVSRCLPLLGVDGDACACDIAQDPPTTHADLALVLKTVPCLEQEGRGAVRRLLDALDAENVLVSFPVHSIGGRSKGMSENYESTFLRMVEERPWRLTRFAFATELAFLVQKGPTANAA